MNCKFDGSRVFFTSDTHFNHKNIIEFCGRPFDSAWQMNETIIANWNSAVGADDIVFHLGDFCMGQWQEWVNIRNRLNGRIYLVLGNHDMRHLNVLQEQGTRYFEAIAQQMFIEIGKRKIYLNHFPMLCYSGSDAGVWQLFGHVHTGGNNKGFDTPRLKMLMPSQYDVGVDNNGFTPVSFARVRETILQQIENSHF